VRIRVGVLLAALVVAFAFGCDSKKDLNKDLKPVDPNAPRPQLGSENMGGGDGEKKKNNDGGAPPVVQ
jgi:hypothetical protein